jgi:hypothetical protein
MKKTNPSLLSVSASPISPFKRNRSRDNTPKNEFGDYSRGFNINSVQ